MVLLYKAEVGSHVGGVCHGNEGGVGWRGVKAVILEALVMLAAHLWGLELCMATAAA